MILFRLITVLSFFVTACYSSTQHINTSIIERKVFIMKSVRTHLVAVSFIKAKFHYTRWFEAGSKLVRSR